MAEKLFLKGCAPALVTPFEVDGAVDYAVYARLVRRQVEAGVDFLVALATTGETPTLTPEEKLSIYELTRKHSGGLPVVVGVGSNSVDGTLANIRLFPDADAYLVVVPFYNKPTQEGMFRYFRAICESAGKPVIIYNVPGRTGANMSAETTLRIAREIPGVIGTKEASGNMAQIKEIIDGAPQGFSVLSGDDALTLPIVEAGGHGVISVAVNALPKEVSHATRLAMNGDFEAARELDAKLQPFYDACFIESNPIPVKEALSQMGLCGGTMRLPLTEATQATADTIAEVLKSWI